MRVSSHFKCVSNSSQFEDAPRAKKKSKVLTSASSSSSSSSSSAAAVGDHDIFEFKTKSRAEMLRLVSSGDGDGDQGLRHDDEFDALFAAVPKKTTGRKTTKRQSNFGDFGNLGAPNASAHSRHIFYTLEHDHFVKSWCFSEILFSLDFDCPFFLLLLSSFLFLLLLLVLSLSLSSSLPLFLSLSLSFPPRFYFFLN